MIFAAQNMPKSFYLLKFFYWIDIKCDLFRFPSPIALWDDTTYAIVKMSWFTFCITCIANLPNHRFPSNESTDMGIYFAHVSVVV